MAGSINQFLGSFKQDVARPSRFDVEIPVPLKLIQYRNLAQQLSFRCENAELPAVTLGTVDRKIYGPVEKQPYLKTYNESTMTFMVSDDMAEKGFFDAWIDLINPKTTFDTSFKSDYVTNISVNQYSVTGEQTYSVSLIDAFPVSVNQLDLDWGNESSHHRLSVTFAYYTWEVNGLASLGSDLLSAGISAGVDMLKDFLDSKGPAGASYKMENIAKMIDKK